MTPDETTKARAEEAVRRARQTHQLGTDWDTAVAVAALEVAAEGWTPPEPVDPDADLARGLIEAHSKYVANAPLLELVCGAIRKGREGGRELERAAIFANMPGVEELVKYWVLCPGSIEYAIRDLLRRIGAPVKE